MSFYDDGDIYEGDQDDVIENFTIPLSVPLDKFNLSHSFTLQGKLGNLTLNYGNLSIHPTTCPATIQLQSTCSTTEFAPERNSVYTQQIHKASSR